MKLGQNTLEDRQKAFDTVLYLKSLPEGERPSTRQIARKAGIALATVYAYSQPGAKRPQQRRTVGVGDRGLPFIDFGSRKNVPQDIAMLRDGIVKAFLAGERDRWAELTQELRLKLEHLKPEMTSTLQLAAE